MVSLILKFVSSCRAADLRVSTAEVLDCLNQLELIDTIDEVQFRTVLRTNFVKSRRDQAKFDRLYHLFFHEMSRDSGPSEDDPFAGLIRDTMEMLYQRANGDMLYRSLLDFLSGDPLAYLTALRHMRNMDHEAPQNVRFNLGPLAGRLEILMQINAVRAKVIQFLDDRYAFTAGIERHNAVDFFNRHLDSAYSLLMHEPRPLYDDLQNIRSYEQHLKYLGERPFSALTQQEVEEVRDVVDRLVRKLKDIVSRRYAARSRGVLDIKKTLRKAMRYQGTPVELAFKKRPPRRGKIVTLCDVSSSVWSAARFMLNILYSLQECFTKVNSFIFVSGLAEVTDIFENHEINSAIEKVLHETDIEYYAPTDYGETFRHFKRDYLDILNKKTTLIIIGDARTNYFHPEDRILSEMREKSRRVIWLNPEPESEWNSGDSEMFAYKPYCHELRPCRNLNQLIEFVEELIL